MAARSSARRDLFLQVSGSVDPLKAILKSGSSALVEFKGDAEKQLDAVEKALREIGSAGAGDGAKQMTQSYNAAFREIRRNAEQVAGAGNGTVGEQLLILMSDVVADANGKATLRFKPYLRVIPLDNEPVAVRRPYAVVSMSDPKNGWAVDIGHLSRPAAFRPG